MITVQRALELMFSSENDFVGEPVSEYLGGKPFVFLGIAVAYLLIVHVGPKFITRPIKLKPWFILWNLFLAVFSILGTIFTLPRTLDMYFGGFSEPTPNNPLYANGSSPSFHSGMCGWNRKVFFDGRVGIWLLLFTLSKTPEMIDTVFLVLQKKKVIFLHWYHHLTVMLYCWHCYTSITPAGFTFASMNYTVHSIMYTYYFICACGFRRVVRPFAPLITGIQILQMIIGVMIVSYLTTQVFILKAPCKANSYNICYGLLMYASYLVLFCKLFYSNYIKRSTPSAGAAAAPADSQSPINLPVLKGKKHQ